MTVKRIALGPSGFKNLIAESDVFVDKSLFIKEIIDSGEKAILITYPRRWGKTINLDMLKVFFEPELENGRPKLPKYQKNKKIFEKLKIGTGGYIDTNEIAYRIALVKKDALIEDTAAKWIEIVTSLDFIDKVDILKSFKTNEKANKKLEFEVKKYVISLKQKFADIDHLESLINDYHQVSDRVDVANTLDSQILQKEKNEKFALLKKAIEEKIEQWQERDLEKYQEIKQEFDLVGRNQGKYPVIYISLKDVTGNSFEEVKKKLVNSITSKYEEHAYLKESISLHDSEKLRFQKYIDQDYQDIVLEDSIKFLSKLLYKHHGERVYILVDEYDKPVNYLLEQSLTDNIKERDKISGLITSIMSTCGKDNEYLEKIILVGIFDTFKKEGGSGFNNLSVYGITSERFSKSFGFTEQDVLKLLEQLDFEEEKHNLVKSNIEDWYNGYSVPIGQDKTMKAYTPWAVMQYLNSAYHGNYYPESYWSKSGASTILLMILRAEVSGSIIQKLTSVIQGNNQIMEFNKLTSLFQYSFTHIGNIEEIITYLLVNSGYLTTQRINDNYHFSIPNHEVRIEFKSVLSKELGEISTGVQAWSGESKMLVQFLDVFNSESDMIKIVQAISKQDPDTLAISLSNVPAIKCYSNNYNFNLLHLGAIGKDATIFNMLLKFCGKDLLKVKDKVTKLNVLDYAHLSKNQEVIELVKKLDPELQEYFKVPGYFESIMCYKMFDITAGPMAALVATSTTAVKLIVDRVMPGYGKVAVGTVTAFFSVCTKDISKAVEKNICADYNNYHGTNGNRLKSLEEFTKYSITKSNTYVTLQECNINDINLSTLEMPALNKVHLGDKHLNFTLCAHKCDSDVVTDTKLCTLFEDKQDSYLIEDIIVGGIGGAFIVGLLGLTGYAAWHQIAGD